MLWMIWLTLACARSPFVLVKEEADLTEDEFLAWCDAQFARYKQPAYVRFTDVDGMGAR
jgi:acyl-CoA synthetase (AMP-forming)/AMP-acid ligase II